MAGIITKSQQFACIYSIGQGSPNLSANENHTANKSTNTSTISMISCL